MAVKIVKNTKKRKNEKKMKNVHLQDFSKVRVICVKFPRNMLMWNALSAFFGMCEVRRYV